MKPLSKELLTFYAFIAVSIIGLTYFVQSYPISGFDLFMTREIQEQRGWDLTFLMKFISIFYSAILGPLTVIFASLFFLMSYLYHLEHHRLIDRFHHVIESQAGNGYPSQRLHFHSGFRCG